MEGRKLKLAGYANEDAVGSHDTGNQDDCRYPQAEACGYDWKWIAASVIRKLKKVRAGKRFYVGLLQRGQ